VRTENDKTKHQHHEKDKQDPKEPKDKANNDTVEQQAADNEKKETKSDSNGSTENTEAEKMGELNIDNFVPKYLYQHLEQENKALRTKLDEVLSAHRRAVDEHNKIAERLKLESEKQVDFKVIRIFRDFLDTIDNLDRTLHWSKQSQHAEVKNFGIGLEMIMNGFKEKVRSHQIEVLSLVGKAFDPAQAEAVEQIDVPKKEQDGIILEESTKGYVYRSHLVRAAQVKVGRFNAKK